GANEEPSDGGPPRVIIYGYDGLPVQLVALPSPDYVPRPEHPPSPDYPIPADALPTAISPGYVPDSDPEEDSKADHADYPADGGDGDDEPSDDFCWELRSFIKFILLDQLSTAKLKEFVLHRL
ncbi:hypothetical protein Tco_1084994, partial [Tanacetum coccineum]